MSWNRPRRLHNLAMSYVDRAQSLKRETPDLAAQAGAKAIALEALAVETYNATCGQEPTRGILEKSLAVLRREWCIPEPSEQAGAFSGIVKTC